MTRPVVSVVTPFFNTASYLTQCIESVLAQSYSDFEYILMDNCSTDGSSEIAVTYAKNDPRIRLIRCTQFLSQLPNYNRALAAISDTSKYCKIVQADDWIFPECLQLMVRAFEQSETIGLVSAYWLNGNKTFENQLGGAGFPRQTSMLPGRECAQWYLRTGNSIFGAQTQVMYRSSLVRDHEGFFDISFPFADLQKCIEILERWDFGFVHQVLSVSRTDDESSLATLKASQPYFNVLLRYIIAQRYAPVFLEAKESEFIIAECKRQYYRILARAVLRFRGRMFWRFHKSMLKALSENEKPDWSYLAMIMGAELLWLASNPGKTTIRALRSLQWKRRSEKTAIQCTDGVRPISALDDQTSKT